MDDRTSLQAVQRLDKSFVAVSENSINSTPETVFSPALFPTRNDDGHSRSMSIEYPQHTTDSLPQAGVSTRSSSADASSSSSNTMSIDAHSSPLNVVQDGSAGDASPLKRSRRIDAINNTNN